MSKAHEAVGNQVKLFGEGSSVIWANNRTKGGISFPVKERKRVYWDECFACGRRDIKRVVVFVWHEARNAMSAVILGISNQCLVCGKP